MPHEGCYLCNVPVHESADCEHSRDPRVGPLSSGPQPIRPSLWFGLVRAVDVGRHHEFFLTEERSEKVNLVDEIIYGVHRNYVGEVEVTVLPCFAPQRPKNRRPRIDVSSETPKPDWPHTGFASRL